MFQTRKSHVLFGGMKGMTVLWGGQLVSMLGTAMADFGIMIWLWQTSESATPFAIYGFCSMVTRIIVSPLAGVFVDRWNKKLTMAISDLGAALTTIVILILLHLNVLEYWHLYIIGVFIGIFESFQHPAFSSAITRIVPKKDYGRANGMRSLTTTASRVLSPMLASLLLSTIGLNGILLIDIITVIIAIVALLLVYIPSTNEASISNKPESIRKDLVYGFKYIFRRKSLLFILLVFLVMNMSLAFSRVLRVPLIMSRGYNELTLASIQSISVLGGLLSSSVFTIWGGPKKKVFGIFFAMIMMGLTTLLMGIGKGLILWGIIGFIKTFFNVMANVYSGAFWQSTVEPEVQGRVFAVTRMISEIARPISMLMAGPLVDNFFEPQMIHQGGLSNAFGWLVGTETGSGIALMFVIVGFFAIITPIAGFFIRDIRNADKLSMKHDVVSS